MRSMHPIDSINQLQNVHEEIEDGFKDRDWEEIDESLEEQQQIIENWKIQTKTFTEKSMKKTYYTPVASRMRADGFKYQKNQISSMQALGLVGTAIGFGSFGYSVVRLYERNWKAAVGGIAVGAVALSLVGWNMNKLKDTVPFMADGDAMDPKEVEKILDASRGKIVSVTFIKRTTGEERTLVGRIGKNYKPTAPTHSAAKQPVASETCSLSMICKRADSAWSLWTPCYPSRLAESVIMVDGELPLR